MWIVIVLIIIGYIIYKFNSDRNDMISKIQNRGGLKNFYPRLFEIFLSDENAKITLEKPDEVIITWRGNYSLTQFKFLQLFNKIRIDYATKTALLGEIQNHWEFPSNTNQDLIVKIIMHDIEQKMQINYDWEGAQNKINDIINNLN